MTVVHTRAHLKRFWADLENGRCWEITDNDMREMVTEIESKRGIRRRFYEKRFFPDGVLLITHDKPITHDLHIDAIWLYQERLDHNQTARRKRYTDKRHNDVLGGGK